MNWTIKRSTDEDLHEILDFLRADYLDRRPEGNGEDESSGSFYPHSRQISEAHKTARLTVLTDATSRKVDGYITGDPTTGHGEILHVFRNRRSGRGRALAKHFIQCAKQQGAIGVAATCAPHTSVVFWERLGFQRGIQVLDNPSTQPQRFYLFPSSSALPQHEPRSYITIELLSQTDSQLCAPMQFTAVERKDEILLADHFQCALEGELLGRAMLERLRLRIHADAHGEIFHDSAIKAVEYFNLDHTSKFLKIHRLGLYD